MKQKLTNLGAMMMQIITENSNMHQLKNQKILLSNEFSCAACYQGKLIVRHHKPGLGMNHPISLSVFIEIYVGLLLFHVDHLDILWY